MFSFLSHNLIDVFILNSSNIHLEIWRLVPDSGIEGHALALARAPELQLTAE